MSDINLVVFSAMSILMLLVIFILAVGIAELVR